MTGGSKKIAYLAKAEEAEREAERAESAETKASWERVARVFRQLADKERRPLTKTRVGSQNNGPIKDS